MNITVIGASGLIGSKLVKLLQQEGHDVVAASLASGVNTLTGEGLAVALTGAQVVVDVTNSPSLEDQAALEFFTTSGRHIVAAAVKAGVTHHVALSVVGTERLQESGYFRGKLGSGKPDQGVAHPLYNSPFHPVFRVSGRHRPVEDSRANRVLVAGFGPADCRG